MRWSPPSSTFPKPHLPSRTPSRFSSRRSLGWRIQVSWTSDPRAWAWPSHGDCRTSTFCQPYHEQWLPRPCRQPGERSDDLRHLERQSFASDPPGVILEQNDIAFVMARDHLDHIATAYDTIFSGPPAELMTITSIRRGFVDGHKIGSNRQSLTKRMAIEAQIPGAVFYSRLGGTLPWLHIDTTGRARSGRHCELRDAPGCHESMAERILHERHGHAFLPHLRRSRGLVRRHPPRACRICLLPDRRSQRRPRNPTLPEGPANAESLAQVERQFRRFASLAIRLPCNPPRVCRRQSPTTTGTCGRPERRRRREQTSILSTTPSHSAPIPRLTHSAPTRPQVCTSWASCLQATCSTSCDAMDGQYGPDVNLGFGAVHGPFNSVLQTTHRQNFLCPSPAHRSFPLAELLTVEPTGTGLEKEQRVSTGRASGIGYDTPLRGGERSTPHGMAFKPHCCTNGGTRLEMTGLPRGLGLSCATPT